MLTQDIKEAIKKSLPAEVGDVLKARLKEADSLEDLVEALKRDKKALDERCAIYLQKDSCFVDLEKKEAELKEKTVEIEKREKGLDVELLTVKINCAEDKAKAFHDFTTGLMRNIEYRSSAFGNSTKHTDNGCSYTDPYNHNTDTKAE